jgi:hypothetical protein
MSRDRVKATKLAIGLPFGIGQLELEPDEVEQRAAWELYVELITRVATRPLEPETGLIREALSSLHEIISVTREVLRKAGPDIAQGPNSLGNVAVEVIVQGIRPFLSKWHPLLLKYEHERSANTNPLEHEQAWEQGAQFHKELAEFQDQIFVYVVALGRIAGIDSND